MASPKSGPSDLRLAIATEMDPWSASTRYRALQHVPRLQTRFASVKVLLPGDTLVRRPGRVGQVRYFGAHAVLYARRAAALPALIEDVDALLVQRGLYSMGPAAVVQSLKGFSGRLVFDLDDAVFQTSPYMALKGPLTRWLYGPQQAIALMRRADEIVVSTRALAEMLPRGLPAPTVIPTVPDPARYAVNTHEAAWPVTVGWAGSVGSLGYLDPLRSVFARLAAEHVARLEVVSSHPWSGPSMFRRWSAEIETSVFRNFAIGIMPLPHSDYARAKGGFKLLQYMAAGIPVVSSPVGVNTELIERSNGGLLADTPDQWEDALRTLAADPQLRTQLGLRGRAFVERYVDLDAQAYTLTNLLAG